MLYLNAAEYLPACGCGLGTILLLLSSHLFAHIIFSISLQYLFSVARISLSFCISVQILYDIHSDILNVPYFLFRSSFVKNLLVVLVMRSPIHYYFTTRRFLFTKVFSFPSKTGDLFPRINAPQRPRVSIHLASILQPNPILRDNTFHVKQRKPLCHNDVK